MNINSISSNNSASMPQNNSSSMIKMLEKQKSQLTDQIKSINESKLDSKTKKERISEVEQQIQQIDAQIQQIKVEDAEKKAENNKISSSSSNETEAQSNENISTLASLSHAKTSLSQAESVGSIKKDLDGQKNVLKMEIKLDAGRSGGETAGKTRKLAKVNERLSSLDISYADKLKKAINEAKNHSEKDDNKKVSDAEKTDDKEKDKNESIKNNDQQEKDTQQKSIDVLI